MISLSVIMWAIVAIGSTLAIYSPLIRDTLAERVALSVVAITSTAAACRAWSNSHSSTGDMAVVAALGMYVLVIINKIGNGINQSTPKDKCKHF